MSIQILPVHVDGEITRGQDIVQAAKGLTCVQKGDVVVFSQKIISKQEGRIVLLDSVMPGSLALGIASAYSKDPRTIQLVLDESSRIVRMRSGVLIMQTHSGLVCANAGVDESNVPLGYAALLPENPDASAKRLRESILQKTGKESALSKHLNACALYVMIHLAQAESYVGPCCMRMRFQVQDYLALQNQAVRFGLPVWKLFFVKTLPHHLFAHK